MKAFNSSFSVRGHSGRKVKVRITPCSIRSAELGASKQERKAERLLFRRQGRPNGKLDSSFVR
jgi:hypothetical protein